MSFKLCSNLDRRADVSFSSTPLEVPLTLKVPSPYKTITKALQKASGNCVIEIYPGNYKESVVVATGVSLVGFGVVIVSGNITLEGKGYITNVSCNSIFTNNGERLLENLSCVNLFAEFSSVKCKDIIINRFIKGKKSNIILLSSCIMESSEEFSITSDESVIGCTDCVINGSAVLDKDSLLDIKGCSLICSKDIIVTLDELSNLQIFNSYVAGKEKIKVGPGKSLRSNVIALDVATEFSGGDDRKIEPI